MSISTPVSDYAAIVLNPGTSLATPSFTPSANTLYGYAIDANADNCTGVSSSGMTWALVDKVSVSGRTVYLYAGVGASPGAGAVTAAFSASTYAKGIVFHIAGTVVTGTAGADAFGTPQHQASYADNHTTPSMAAFAAGSICLAVGGHEQNESLTPAGSLQLLVENSAANPGQRVAVFYQMTENRTPGFTAAHQQYGGIIGVEVKAAAAVADRHHPRGVQRAVQRGMQYAMGMVQDVVTGLWRPRDTRLVVPVGIAL